MIFCVGGVCSHDLATGAGGRAFRMHESHDISIDHDTKTALPFIYASIGSFSIVCTLAWVTSRQQNINEPFSKDLDSLSWVSRVHSTIISIPLVASRGLVLSPHYLSHPLPFLFLLPATGISSS